MRMARKKKPVRRRKSTPVYEESRFNLRMPAIVRDNPLDSFGLFLVAAAAAAIVVNATMLQDISRLGAGASSVTVAPAPRPSSIAELAANATAQDANMLVREVQAELARRGLYDGPADGLFGPKTEAAILDFEMGAGLEPTGKPNPQLLAAMRGGGTAVAVSSSQVMAVQNALNALGFGPMKADGVFGEATRSALRRFEASRNLPQRGELSSGVLRELSSVSGVKLD